MKFQSRKKCFGLIVKLSLHTLEMKLRGSRFLWLTGLSLSKSTQMNVYGFTLAQNRILQIMLQGALAYAIKTKLRVTSWSKVTLEGKRKVKLDYNLYSCQFG